MQYKLINKQALIIIEKAYKADLILYTIHRMPKKSHTRFCFLPEPGSVESILMYVHNMSACSERTWDEQAKEMNG